jgi:PAS domain S-box-containing protein
LDNNSFFLDLINNISDGVYFVDRDRVITFWNRTAEKITGFESSYVIGHGCRENILNHVTENGINLCENGCPLAKCMKDGKPREAYVFLHHKDGHRVPVYIHASPIHDSDGKIIGAVETFSKQNTQLRSEVKDLRLKVFTDPLTEIRNRRYLEKKLRREFPTPTGIRAVLD